MSKSPSTKNGAKIYREAARLMEGGNYCYAATCGFSCCALSKASPRHDNSVYLEAKSRLFEYFGDADWINQPKTPENQANRITSLCFLAAMVEAGDA